VSQPKEHKPPAGPKVSPVRTIISLLLLLVVGVICAIELRAGLGQFLTGKAFAAKSKEGEFEAVKLTDAKSMVSMFPTETLHRSGPGETVVKYEWFSLLRPLMGQTNPTMYIVAEGGDDPDALAYHTEADDEEAVATPAAGTGGPPGGMSMPGMGPPGGMSMPGMGGPGMGGPGGGGPGGGGRGPGGGRGEGGKDRPEMEEEPAATDAPATDAAPAAEGTTPPATDTPATDTPATDAPATDTPATDTPATDAPATDTPATDTPAASEPGGVPPQ